MDHYEKTRPRDISVEFGEPVAFGEATPEQVLTYAALGSEPGSDSGLERALVADAVMKVGVLDRAEVVNFDAATNDRPFSLADIRTSEGESYTIARGEPRALVEKLVKPAPGRHARAIVSKAFVVSRSYRPLAVAIKPEGGEWAVAGYIPVRAWSQPIKRRGLPFDFHPVWDGWLRLAHWSWVALVLILTVTGYFIADPGWMPKAWVTPHYTGYFMGYVRFIHYTAGALLILVLLVRAWNLTTSKIRYDRWRALLPARNKREVGNIWRTFEAYLFVRPSQAPVYFGHNPLQQAVYTLTYFIFWFQIFTGLALWGLYSSHTWYFVPFQWFINLVGAQQVRLLHYMIMWGFLLFIPLHVYLSIRSDSVERTGAISSMFNGGRWIRRGAKFEDWPPPEASDPSAPVLGHNNPDPVDPTEHETHTA